MNTDDENYIDDEENSVMELLQNEFRRLHPTITRRLALIKKSQRAEQSSLAFLSEVKRDALSANLRDVDEQALTCMILINGLSSEELRAELLDLFEVDEDLTLATIESGIRKYEANKKTTDYVQGRKSDLFQVSNYKNKKSERQRRKEYALANYFCDKCQQKGHTMDRCHQEDSEDSSSSSSNESSKDDNGYGSNEGRNSNNHLHSLTQPQDEPEIDEEGRFVNTNLSFY